VIRMSTPAVALGEMPSQSERRESGRIAASIVELVKRGAPRAEPLHALLGTLTLRELALTVGALGAVVCAYGDQLDSVCLGGVKNLKSDSWDDPLGSLTHVA
jgi:hypothetical protein